MAERSDDDERLDVTSQRDVESCSCEKNIRKHRVYFPGNICEYSFNKEYTRISVFETYIKLKIFTKAPDVKSKLK